MSAGFTPGPWEPSNNRVHVAGKGNLCTVENPWNNIAEREANARLIAAAPELFSGCNALLGLIQLLAANHETPPALLRILTENHRIIEAERAVAKARGDQ